MNDTTTDTTTDTMDLGHGVTATRDDAGVYFPDEDGHTWWASFGNDDAIFLFESTTGPADMRWMVLPWAGWSCGGRAGSASHVATRARAVEVACAFVDDRHTFFCDARVTPVPGGGLRCATRYQGEGCPNAGRHDRRMPWEW